MITPTEATPRDSRARLLIPAIVLAMTALVYLPSLRFAFVCDDGQQIVLNQGRFTWQAIPSYFTTDVWSYISLVKSNYYRPVFLVWLMLNYQIAGLNAVLWHAGSIAAHLAATLMVYFLALRLTGKPAVAGAAGLLFGVHPVHVEAVAWISGSTETLFAVLGLGTLLGHLRWRDSCAQARPPAQRGAWRAAEIVFFALALFTKETAVIFPAVLCAWDWLFPISPPTKIGKRIGAALSGILPHALVICVYIFARYHALGTFAPLTRNWPLPALIRTWPFALSFYLRQLLIPFQYSLLYNMEPVRHFGISEAVFHLLPVLLAAGTLVWISRRSAVNAFCALLFVLPLLPALNLRVFTFEDFLHDRYAYVPSAGLCILAAIAFEKWIPGVPLRAAALLAVAAGLAAVTIQMSDYWKDNLALYTRAVEVAPASVQAAAYLGEELVEEERWADALPWLKQSLGSNPNSLDSYDTYLRIAKCYLGLDDLAEAISYFQDAIVIAPSYPSAYLDLAVVEYKANLLQPAEDHMRLALRLRSAYSPLFERYHFRLAVILEREEKWSEALAEYQAELKENPGAADAAEGLERVQARLAAK